MGTAVIDAIYETVCEQPRRGQFLNAGENMKVVADELVRPYAKGVLSTVCRCSHCGRAGEPAETHAEWSYPVVGQDCVEVSSDKNNDEHDGGKTVALRLVDRIQGMVSGAVAGVGDSETDKPKMCTFCDVGVVQRYSAVTAGAPEFFVLRPYTESEESTRRADGGVRIDFGGKVTLRFPSHEGGEGDPPEGFIAHFAASSTRRSTSPPR